MDGGRVSIIHPPRGDRNIQLKNPPFFFSSTGVLKDESSAEQKKKKKNKQQPKMVSGLHLSFLRTLSCNF